MPASSKPTAVKDVSVRRGDRAAPEAEWTLPVTVVLDNLRSAFNVGNILRIADAVRAAGVVACGCTAAPPHPKLAKTARGCDETVPVRRADEAARELRDFQERGFRIYGVETTASARFVWDEEYRFPAVLVLGNEALGISAPALALCDAFVSLPAFGLKNSINVGNCAAVALYEVLRQWLVGRELSGLPGGAAAATRRAAAGGRREAMSHG